MTPITTRVFKNGHSQAVRIPAELRLDTDKVRIFRNEQGDLVIQPLRVTRGQALMAALAEVDRDFVTTLEADLAEGALPPQERDPL